MSIGFRSEACISNCVRHLLGREMDVFATAGIPYLVISPGPRSRKREKCYSAVDIIEQIGGCRIRINYGYSLVYNGPAHASPWWATSATGGRR